MISDLLSQPWFNIIAMVVVVVVAWQVVRRIIRFGLSLLRLAISLGLLTVLGGNTMLLIENVKGQLGF